MSDMADTIDAAADNGQPISDTENTIAGPSPPQMAEDVVAHEGGENKNDDMKVHQTPKRTFQLPVTVQKTHLLAIPPEIRNMIFKLCLCHPDDIGDKLKVRKNIESFTIATNYQHWDGIARPKVEEAYDSSVSARTKKAIRQHSLRNLALMRTCQAIYDDAAPVLWGQKFTFRTILQLQNFLLTPNMRHDLVRDVKVWKLDYNVGVNFMPSVCVLLADKLKGLEAFDVDMSQMRGEKYINGVVSFPGWRDDEHAKKAGKNLGFGIYSCMYPWVTKVVREQGIDKLMTILQIVRETGPINKTGPGIINSRVAFDFRGRGQLTATQRAMVDAATAEEILRQIDLYANNV